MFDQLYLLINYLIDKTDSVHPRILDMQNYLYGLTAPIHPYFSYLNKI